MTNTIRLKALDTLFFKDGKPFDKGEETWANGIFPPYPSVIYGSLRSLYYILHPSEIGNENTVNDKTLNLQINDIKVRNAIDYFYPCPYDVVKKKADKSGKPLLLTLANGLKNTSSNLPAYLSSNIKVEPIEGFLIGDNFEEEYLKGHQPKRYRNLKEFISAEPKVGIGRDNITGITQEGLLYRVGMIRPKKIEIEIDFHLKDWVLDKESKGFMKIGAEGKSCAYEVVSSLEEATNAQLKLEGNIFKVCFVTPTILKRGWLPDFLDDDLEGYWQDLGLKVKLLTVAMDKPKYIGGFDMKAKRPKPMTRMLPAGTVLYFEILDEKREFILPRKIKLIDDANKAKEGFGIAYLAMVKKD